MPFFYIYPIYTAVLGIILVTIVPRTEIKKIAIYGIILGGVLDVLAIFLVSFFLKLGGYINFNPFGFRGLAFFPPIAWSIWFIIFFYFLPEKKFFKHIYILTAAGYSVMFSNVLVKLHIMRWTKSDLLIPFIIYISWLYLATFIKNKVQRI